jgi:serine O-acetyltransferase
MDAFIAHLCEKLGDISSGVPDALRIYKHGRDCFLKGDLIAAKKCQTLNYILHNSVIPSECVLADGVVFGYGGIGVVLHPQSNISSGVIIGSNVTVGGGASRGSFWLDDFGNRMHAPRIHSNVYIATGAKILGGIEIGALSVIGANSVVISNIPPLSIVIGAPGRVVKKITLENCLSYKSHFYSLREISNKDFISMVSELVHKQEFE